MPPRKGAVERLLRSVLNEAAAVGEERLEETLRNLRARLSAPAAFGAVDDPFVVLGVSPTDPLDLVVAVYRTKAKFLHPDNKDTGSAEAFKRLQEAYAAVVNAVKNT